MVRWWNNEGMMLKTWWSVVKIRWWNCDGMMMKTGYSFHHRVIASLWFHHRAIVVSSSAIVFSLSYHRLWALLPLYHHKSRFREQKMLLMSNRTTVIGHYIQYCVVEASLTSRFASRTSTREKKILWRQIPLCSIPYIISIKLTFLRRYKT
jgi:hypothetical protein